MELNFHKINSLQNFHHLVIEQSTYTNDLGKGGGHGGFMKISMLQLWLEKGC
jgi:hypothetical protein